MRFLLDLLQASGTSAAIGIRPFLPALLVCALASANLGVDFDGTDFEGFESPWFMLALAVAAAGVYLLPDRWTTPSVLEGAAVGLAMLTAMATFDDRFDAWWAGAIVGFVFSVLGSRAAHGLLERVRTRLDRGTARALPVYADGVGLAGAGLSVLFPPLGALLVALLAFLLRGGKRREGEKYAGLRILR